MPPLHAAKPVVEAAFDKFAQDDDTLIKVDVGDRPTCVHATVHHTYVNST